MIIRQRLEPLPLLAPALLLLASITTAAVAGEEGEAEETKRIIHKVLVHCDKEIGKECMREMHIDALHDADLITDPESHELMWIGGAGPHQRHISMHRTHIGKGGYLGVQLVDLTPELRQHFGVDAESGVMVSKVMTDSPANRAGLQVGDIITGVGDQRMGSSRQLARAIRRHDQGDTVEIEVWRSGVTETVSATLDERENLVAAPLKRTILVQCDEGEDCDIHFDRHMDHDTDFGCPEGERCEIQIKCGEGDCSCTVNGEQVACEDVPGFSAASD